MKPLLAPRESRVRVVTDRALSFARTLKGPDVPLNLWLLDAGRASQRRVKKSLSHQSTDSIDSTISSRAPGK